MNDFEDDVKETLEGLYEEEAGQDEAPAKDEAPEGNGETEDKEEEFAADSFDDFLEKTETKVEVKKEGKMPSPIFGNRDSRNHNKYRVTLRNGNGSASFTFWDSINNTEKGIPLDRDEAIACFANDVASYEDNPSYEGFKQAFGYDETEENIAQKAFNGCRKHMEQAKKLFTDAQLEELKRLAAEH